MSLILQSRIIEILKNLRPKHQFTLATTCHTLWNCVIQFIPIENKKILLNYQGCKV